MSVQEIANQAGIDLGAKELKPPAKVGEATDLTSDGGVLKEIITKGSGWESPEKGDKVSVHYVGTLESDGSEFDSSRGRGDPFTFTLGQSQVIKGWDVGVATMKKGEVAKFTIRADYGYGDSGSPPKIPGGATLVFEVELLSWKSVKDISGDGGVIKTIIKEGEGYPTPRDVDEVRLEFEASVQGADAPFYKTPEGGVEFILKDGNFCKAISTAAKTMKKGEQAKLVVKPEYGFGAAGQSPDVPPNATLEINLTMVGWKKISNVTTDGGVVKKVLKESESWQRPNEGATVTIRYTARLTDGTIFDEYTTNPLQFVIDGSQAPCEGLELALMQMKKGETALVSMEAKYAFGEAGATFPKAKVPPGASVEYEVEVVDFQKGKDTWEIIDVDEKIKEAATSKERGTVAFKANKLERCVDLWERAIQAVEQDDKFSHEQKKAAKEIRRACNLNLAAVHLKTRRSEEARKAADKVLETDSYNLKALYRRAQAYMQTEDWLEASQDIKKALSVEPDNVDFKLLARKLKAAEAEAARGTAQMWSSTFKKMGAAPAAEKKENSAPPAAEPMTEG